MLQKIAKNSFFDLIFINQEAIKYEFDEFQVVLPILFKYLNRKYGIMLMNAITPLENVPNSDNWKLLIYVKTFLDVDSALGAFDNGILLIRGRMNQYQIHNDTNEIDVIYREVHMYREVNPSEFFFGIADKFLPVLDFFYLHHWLSMPEGTVKFTSVPWNKLCIVPPYFGADNLMENSRPLILCP